MVSLGLSAISTPQQPSQWCRTALSVVGLLALLPVAAFAQSQTRGPMSGETILESIVDDYGPKYQDVDVAIEQLRTGRVTDARESFAAARRKNPNLPPANLMLAEVFFRSQQAAAAQMALEEAVREDPNDPGAYVYLGEFAVQARRIAEAGLLFNKTIDLLANYSANDKRKDVLTVAAFNGLTTLAEAREDWTTAKQYLQKVLQVDPKNSLALTRLGRAMFKLATDKEEEKAVWSIYKQLHENDVNTAYQDVNMALLYDQAGKLANAEVFMKRAANEDSGNLRTQIAVANWALERGKLELAEQAVTTALKLDATSVDALVAQGRVARFKKDLASAEKAFMAAHLSAPTNLTIILQIAQTLAESADEEQLKQAYTFAQLGTRMAPDLKEPAGREAAVTMAWTLSRLKQDVGAARAIEQVVSAGDGRLSADSAYYAAQILYNNGMNENAQKILEQTLQADPVFMNREAAQELLNRIRAQ